jgi:hypothetical protein
MDQVILLQDCGLAQGNSAAPFRSRECIEGMAKGGRPAKERRGRLGGLSWFATSRADESRTPFVSASRTPISENCGESGAESGARSDDLTPSDPDLAYLIDRWPDLPKETRRAILALVAGQKEKGRI